MKLWINGEELTFREEVADLARLLNHLELNTKGVVIEHNETVVPRQKLDSTSLQEGDKIEIVQFVGGGKDTEEKPEPTEPAAEPAEAGAAAEAPAKPKKPRKKKAPAASKKSASKGGPRNLVIVESPAKAKTINKFLGDDFQVEASFGHVRDLPKSKMGVDPNQDFAPHYIIIAKARKTVSHLKKQAQGKEGIYLAPDPDREGEAISWHLSHIFSETNPEAKIQRVVFNEITKEAVQEAFRHPREIRMNLVNAQQARRILDRIVGYELSPLLWRKVGRGLSAGRVQSVALRLIVDREREIKSFVPVEYWSMEAKLSSEKTLEKIFKAKLDKIGNEKADLKTGEQIEKIRQEVVNAQFRVEKVEKKERTRRPQAPFTTSKLQQESYNKLGFPAAKTMRVAQRLYEGMELGEEGAVGLITYMRTDSVNVAVSAQQEAAKYIQEKYGKDYLPATPPVYKSKKGAQEAHEAIRPSYVHRHPDSIRQYLAEEEFKLYELIWRKFLSSQMTPAVDENIAVSILAGKEYFFKATGRRNLFPGFGILYDDGTAAKSKNENEDSEESKFEEIPELIEGEILKLHNLEGNQHFTKPPARFNDASLVKSLEEQGIGRPSTYAPIIYTLVFRDYVNRKGGALQPTELGETVSDLLVKHFAKVMDVQFTANMEGELDKIEDGEKEWVEVLKRFCEPFSADVAVAREEMKNMRQDPIPTEYTCDVCTKPMVIKWGRFGKFMACSGFPDCKTTRSIPTGFKCPEPNCGGDLIKRMSKKRRTFYGCSKYPQCNHITNKLPKPENENAKDEEASPSTQGNVEI